MQRKHPTWVEHVTIRRLTDNGDEGDWTPDLLHAKQTRCHCATSPQFLNYDSAKNHVIYYTSNTHLINNFQTTYIQLSFKIKTTNMYLKHSSIICCNTVLYKSRIQKHMIRSLCKPTCWFLHIPQSILLYTLYHYHARSHACAPSFTLDITMYVSVLYCIMSQ